MFTKIPGTKDILPDEVIRWQKIEETGRRIFSLYNYTEIRPPLIEDAALFNRSLGEATEVVQKQMFLIRREDDTYALRPEATASVVRAYIENNLDKLKGFVKLYYIGPMFRAERPQKGRLRQFHHLGCETIGSADPGVDVEVISLACRILDELGIREYVLQLNSLGCAEDRKRFGEILDKGLAGKVNDLCEECQRRFKTNKLRILDCKNESCRRLVRSLDLTETHLCPECKEHFDAVKQGLDSLGIAYRLNPCLVRGLDYYTRTVFEITHSGLGSQDALGAGGRYDTLTHTLGGPQAPAMGFAFGIERLMLVAPSDTEAAGNELVYVIPLGEAAKTETVRLLDALRKAGVAADTDYESRSLKGAMRKANDASAGFVVIIGDDELKKKAVTVKDMASGEQKEVALSDIVRELALKSKGPEKPR